MEGTSNIILSRFTHIKPHSPPDRHRCIVSSLFGDSRLGRNMSLTTIWDSATNSLVSEPAIAFASRATLCA